MFIVEAEDATVDLADTDALKTTIVTALEKQGLTVTSSASTKTSSGSIINIMLSDGYVIARSTPEHKYCGFDVHFWNNFDQHESTKDALAAAIGSTKLSTSAFRIIAGGIFGMPSWQKEQKDHGPQYEEICNQRSEARKNVEDSTKVEKKFGTVSQDVIDSTLQGTLSLITEGSKKIAMLVGNDGKVGSSSALKGMKDVEVNTIYCPSMINFNEFSDDALNAATVCERQLLIALEERAENDKFNMLVIDSSADKRTASILLKILSARRKKLAKDVLESNTLVVSLLLDESEKWRQHLLQIFKNDIFQFDPSSYSEVDVSTGAGAMKILLAMGSDPKFVKHLNEFVSATENGNPDLSLEVQMVQGAQLVYNDDPFEPEHSFLPSDYDQTSPLKQWNSQKPLGHQIIFQMEYAAKSKYNVLTGKSLTASTVKKNLENAIAKTAIPGLELNGDTIQEYCGIGDGCAWMVTWSSGSIALLWDGKKHIDVNLFTYEQNTKQADAFEMNFRTEELTTMLRDEQPRGIGRVISYFDDIKEDAQPHWA